MSYSTLLTKNEEARFLLRSSYKNIRTLYIFSGIMLATGILFTFLFTGRDSFYGCLVISFSLVMLMISLSQNLAHKSFYTVSPDYVLLKKGFSRRTIKHKDIVELRIVNEQEAMSQLIKYQEEEQESRNNLATMDSFEARRKLGKFISYCTVPIIFNETTIGSYKATVKSGATTQGEFVLLSSKKGAHFLLTPQDCKGFVKEVEKFRQEKMKK